jgi:hypothetical protein
LLIEAAAWLGAKQQQNRQYSLKYRILGVLALKLRTCKGRGYWKRTRE